MGVRMVLRLSARLKVEADARNREVIAARMADGFVPRAKVYPDVCTFSPSGSELASKGVLAGFPCQGVSQAGLEGGLSDPRTGLLRECWRIFDSLPHATFMVLENVANLRSRKMREIFEYIIEAGSG